MHRSHVDVSIEPGRPFHGRKVDVIFRPLQAMKSEDPNRCFARASPDRRSLDRESWFRNLHVVCILFLAANGTPQDHDTSLELAFGVRVTAPKQSQQGDPEAVIKSLGPKKNARRLRGSNLRARKERRFIKTTTRKERHWHATTSSSSTTSHGHLRHLQCKAGVS